MATNEYPFSYRLLVVFLLLFLIFYTAVSLYAEVVRNKEIPHFFSWFVFIQTPQREQEEYAIRILEYQGKRFESPVFLNESEITFSSKSFTTPEYSRRANVLGVYLVQGRTDLLDTARQEVEALFLPGKTRYEVVKIIFNPIERLKTGKIKSIEQIAEFEVNISY